MLTATCVVQFKEAMNCAIQAAFFRLCPQLGKYKRLGNFTMRLAISQRASSLTPRDRRIGEQLNSRPQIVLVRPDRMDPIVSQSQNGTQFADDPIKTPFYYGGMTTRGIRFRHTNQIVNR